MLEKNHRNGMEEILNNMDTMQKLMSSIAVTYDTSDEDVYKRQGCKRGLYDCN